MYTKEQIREAGKKIIPIGKKVSYMEEEWEIGSVMNKGGERYYGLIAKDGSVALVPDVIIETQKMN